MQLSAWTGWDRVVTEFEASGFGLIGHFASIASDLCARRFSPEAFQQEQCEKGQRWVNHLFGERIRPARGELRGQLQQVLAQLPESERLARFRQPLYALREREIPLSDDAFEITSKKHIRDYAERVGAGIGYAVEKHLTRRRLTKRFEGWLVGVVSVEVGGSDRLSPQTAELAFEIEIEEGGRPMSATIGLGDVAEAIVFYQSITPPRSLTAPPPDRDDASISKMARHGVRAQLRFFDLLLTDLAEHWRAQSS